MYALNQIYKNISLTFSNILNFEGVVRVSKHKYIKWSKFESRYPQYTQILDLDSKVIVHGLVVIQFSIP